MHFAAYQVNHDKDNTYVCMCLFTCARHSTLVVVRGQLVRAGSLLPHGHREETQAVMAGKRTHLLSHPRQPLPSLLHSTKPDLSPRPL